MEPRIVAGPAWPTGRRAVRRASSAGSARCRRHAGRGGHPGPRGRGLLGRGGAGFPVGRKWRSVASAAPARRRSSSSTAPRASRSARRTGRCCASGRTSCSTARCSRPTPSGPTGSCSTSARSIGTRARRSSSALARARPTLRMPVDLVDAPATLRRRRGVGRRPLRERGDARPTTTPPRPYERGIGGRPTLVQNVESLAHAALIAPVRPGWYRERGRSETPGHRAHHGRAAPDRDGVREIEIGTTVGELARRPARAVARRTSRRCCSAATSAAGSPRTAAGTSRSTRSPCATRGPRSAAGVVAFLGNDRCGVAGDGPDPGLDGRPERRPVRSVRVRAAGHRGRDRADRRRPARARRPRADRALVPPARRPWRLPPPDGAVGQL